MGASAEDIAMFSGAAKAPADAAPDSATPDDVALFAAPSAPPKPSFWGKAASTAGDVLRGAGTMATNAVDAATLGGYSRARDYLASKIAPDATAANATAEDKFNTDHPYLASMGRALGYIAPVGAPAMIADAVGAAGRMAAERAPSVVSDFLASHAATAALARNAATGAAVNGATTFGQDVTQGAPLKDSLADAGDAAVGGAMLGAGIGAGASVAKGAANAIREKLQPAARARVIKQAVSDFVGTKETGRAIDTDVKKMSRAIGPIRDELGTPEGLKIADTARSDPDAALTMVKDKIEEVTHDRTTDYKTVDAATDHGGVRVGDYVGYLDNQAKALRNTGTAKNVGIATELENASARIKAAGDWGGPTDRGTQINRDAKFDDNYTVGQYLDLMRKVRSPGMAAQARKAIADVEANPKFRLGSPTFDPDAVVPTVKLREQITDLQNTAFEGMGGINGTERFRKAKDVADVAKKFLDDHLEEVEKKNPEAADAVARIRAMNRRVNAFATLETALETRVGKADTASMKMSPSTETELGVGGAVAAIGHPGAAVTGFAAKKALPILAGVADRAVTRGIANWTPDYAAPVPPAGAPANGVRQTFLFRSPAVKARLIQIARAPGATVAQVQEQAKKDGVPPEVAANIAEQNGLQ